MHAKAAAPVFLIFLALSMQAVALTPLEANSMEARVLITNTVRFEQAGYGYRMDEATGRLTWFPRDDQIQDIKEMRIEPQATQSEESILFHWPGPLQAETLSVQSTVVTRNAIVPVRERVPFPLQEVPQDIARYLEPGEITDQDPRIQRLAQELAAGKTDAYEVVFALADWTTSNVNYSLQSLGEPAIQKSSQVIESRWGKCDEITALFISLNRAAGIPARFVAGYAYTNSDAFPDNWGGHGWAEVWLPGAGWVPFDVTYGEYGYLDAGHVKLKVSHDAKETSIDYSARGRGFTLVTEPLDIHVTPLRMSAHSDPDIRIELDTPYDEVGFGSAVPVTARVTNLRDHYVSTRLDLARTTNADMLSDTYQNILLRPRETKAVEFLVRIEEDLDPRYRYEFPFRVSSRLGQEAAMTISVLPEGPIYDASVFLQRSKSSRQSFSVTCDRGAAAYVGMPAEHACAVEGLVPGDGLVKVCDAQGSCENLELASGTFILTTRQSRPGVRTSAYTATLAGKSTSFFVSSKAIGPAEVEMIMDHPAAASPDDSVLVSVNLTGKGVPHDVVVTLRVNHAEAVERIEVLDRPAVLLFSMPARALRPGDNKLEVTAAYVDELGTAGTSAAASTMQLVNASWMDHVTFWLEDAGSWIAGLFS